MKLKGIRLHYFRGFGAGEWLELNADLVAIWGPNGHGKTSIAEGIEWLFFTSTKRRVKGEELSRDEYLEANRNVHAPEDEQTYVEALVANDAGEEMYLRRTLVDEKRGSGEQTDFTVDGKTACPEDLGLSRGVHDYPVIVQHGLQDFIQARPVDRRTQISSALGLDSLVEYVKLVDSAIRSLQKRPPEDVNAATRQLKQGAHAMSSQADLATIADRWLAGTVDLRSDADEIVAICSLGTGGPTETLKALHGGLMARQAEVAKSVLDLSTIGPPDGSALALEEARDVRFAAAQAIKDSIAGWRRLTDATVRAYGMELLSFWQKGLELSQTHSEVCPMCEEATLGPARRAEIEGRINQSAEYREGAELVGKAVTDAETALSQLADVSSRLLPAEVDEKTVVYMAAVLGEPDVASFRQANEEAQKLIESTVSGSESLQAELQEFGQGLLELPEQAQVERQAIHLLCLVGELDANIRQACSIHANAFDAVELRLHTSIASTAQVQEVNAMLVATSPETWTAAELLDSYDELMSSLKEERSAAQDFLETKQKELLDQRGAEIAEWYGGLCPAVEVGFSKMEAAGNAIRLYAESYGKEMSAAACLSQSQLNALGLALHITIALDQSSPFGFIVLDDPIQAFDDDHTQAFIANVVPELLLEGGRQVIVLSHEEPLIRNLREESCSCTCQAYKMVDYTQNGPVLECYTTIGEDIKELKTLAGGNQDDRSTCARKMRICCDRIVRGIYCSETGQCMPTKLASANTGDLIKALKDINELPRSTSQQLKAIAGFCAPEGHDDLESQTPNLTHLTPHISRLDNLAKKYDILQWRCDRPEQSQG